MREKLGEEVSGYGLKAFRGMLLTVRERRGIESKRREKVNKSKEIREKLKSYLEGLSEEEIKKGEGELYEGMREEVGEEVLEYGLEGFKRLLQKERKRRSIESKKREKVNKAKEIRDKVKSYLEGLGEEEIKKGQGELYEGMTEILGDEVLAYGLKRFSDLLLTVRERRSIESKRAEKVNKSKEIRDKVKRYLGGLSEEEMKKESKKIYEQMREDLGESVLEYGLVAFRRLLQRERERRGLESEQTEKVSKSKEIREKIKGYLEGLGEEEMKKESKKIYEQMREELGESVLEYGLNCFSNLLLKERERRSIKSEKTEKVNKVKEIREMVKSYLEELSEEEIKKRGRKELYKSMREELGEAVLEYSLKCFTSLLQKERERRGLVKIGCKKPDILKILSTPEISRRIYDLVKEGKDLEEAKEQAVQEWEEREKTSGETGGGLENHNNL